MAQVYTVTASTSVVQITSLQVPNTVVLLSSIAYPGHIVGIRDATGLAEIVAKPIIISTMQGLQLYDGTSSVVLNQPYGYVSLSSRNPTTWQVLNTQGFLNVLSNAFLETLTSLTANVTTVSTVQEFTSSLTVANVNVTNSIQILGNANIQGDIAIGGSLNIFSSARMVESLNLSSGLLVGGTVSFPSSLFVSGDVTIGSNLSTTGNMAVKDSLIIDKSLFAQGVLLPPFVSTQTLSVDRLETEGGVQVRGGVSTQTLFTGGSLFVAGSGTVQEKLYVQQQLSLLSSLTVDGNLTTRSLQASTFSAFQGVQTSTLSALSLSTLNSVVVSNFANLKGAVTVEGPVFVANTAEIRDLYVQGQASISSLRVFSSFQTDASAVSYGSTFHVLSDFQVLSSFVVRGSLDARNATVSTGFYAKDAELLQNLTVGKLLTVGNPSWVGSALTIGSSMTVEGEISTGHLTVKGSLLVLEDLFVGQTASASTLGAPIRFDISTLTLSNRLEVGSYASIPEFQTGSFPLKMAAGAQLDDFGPYDLYVDGILQNRSTITQTGSADYSKLWSGSRLQTSTLLGTSNLSTVVIGNTNVQNPLLRFSGILAAGVPVTGSPIYWGSNVDSPFNPTLFSATFSLKKIRYNGTNQWLAVGQGLTAVQSIWRSSDGYTWSPSLAIPAAIGPVNDVAYGNGLWVIAAAAAGGPTLFYSGNGANWSNTTNSFLGGGAVANSLVFSGSLWVAGGETAAGGGLKYSPDGITWVNTTINPAKPIPSVLAVGYGDGNWKAYASPPAGSPNYYLESSNGSFWTSQIDSVPIRKLLCFAYHNNQWLAGGSNITGPTSPIPSIWSGLTPNPSVTDWKVSTDIFQNACTDIQWDSNQNLWLAAGDNGAGSPSPFFYSPNVNLWIPFSVFNGIGRSIAPGSLRVPSPERFFTANVQSLFRSTLSSSVIYASTLFASSFQGIFSGDGSLLSNIQQYGSTLFVSSIAMNKIFARDISAALIQGICTTGATNLTVTKQPFFSSGNIYIAAGNDSVASGSILLSADGSSWARALGPSFNYYGNGIAGNSNITSPLYLAVGADSAPSYTIQYSVNGNIWFPAESGGFEYSGEDGIHEGTAVAYVPAWYIYPDAWFATGKYLGSTATIQQSIDGKNWTSVDNGFQDAGRVLKVGVQYNIVGIGTSEVKYYSPFYSGTFETSSSPLLTAIGYGVFNAITQWIGVFGTQVYQGGSYGQSFTDTGFTTLFPVLDLHYANNTWVAVGEKYIQTSTDGQTWSYAYGVDGAIYKTVTYNTNKSLWVVGGSSVNPSFTILTSSDLINWNPTTNNTGFSTSVENYGQGFGIVSLGHSTFAVGAAAATVETRVRPAILSLLSTPANQYITQISLTASNASNVFSSVVRGIGATDLEINKYVAVGDGATPQKTIARSPDGTPGSWIPAITGGFSTTGYGVTYFNSNWIAVGDGQTTRNTIQYSPDGANWFGTNLANGLRRGGRGIAVGVSTLSSVLVAVGKDTTTSTMLYSYDGFNWSNVTGSTDMFRIQGNGVAAGYEVPPNPSSLFVAVGQSIADVNNATILRSVDGINWTEPTGGFTIAGNGVAYGNNTWVAVGQSLNPAFSILYSTDGALNWSQAGNAFTSLGNAVTYNDALSTFFAVGKDVDGNSGLTVKWSVNGSSWTNFSTGYGFLSQKAIGSANDIFTQSVLTAETLPYMSFCNLYVYERASPLLYTSPTIRLQSSFMVLTEGVSISSSRIFFGSNVNAGNTIPATGVAVTVMPYATLTSSLILNFPAYFSSFLNTSTLIVSSMSTLATTSLYQELQTPSLVLNPPLKPAPMFMPVTPDAPVRNIRTRANYITPAKGTYVNQTNLTVNDVFYGTTQALIPSKGALLVGGSIDSFPGNSVPYPVDLTVGGSLGTSTLSTNFTYASLNTYISASREYIRDTSYAFYEGTTSFLAPSTTTIQTTASSITFNSVLTLQTSTQKVGVFTQNPKYELDVQGLGILNTLQTPRMHASLVLLYLQTL